MANVVVVASGIFRCPRLSSGRDTIDQDTAFFYTNAFCFLLQRKLLPKVNVGNDTEKCEQDCLGEDKVLELGVQIALSPCSEQMSKAQCESSDNETQHEMCSRFVGVDDGEQECQRDKDQDDSTSSLFDHPFLVG